MSKILRANALLTIIVILIMIAGMVLPSALAASTTLHTSGFNKGISWKPYIPMKKITMVDFDEDSYLDDYSYLASVPTSVFYDNEEERLFSNPLLFFQDEYIINEEKERSLNARQGIDYFMEDWMAYCNGKLDQMTLINILPSRLESSWKINEINQITGDNPFDIAADIALHDWSYSDEAVVAVIKESFEQPDNTTIGRLDGALSTIEGILTEHFEIPQTNEMYPIYNEFTVPEGYKFIKVRSWYPSFYIDLGLPMAGFESMINMTIPAGDRDLQIYCEQDGQWMMAGITAAWNALQGMDHDKTSVYVYNSGRWSVALTDTPTKQLSSLTPFEDVIPSGLEVQKHRSILNIIEFGRYGRIIDILKNLRKVTYQVDVEMYPGVMIEIPDLPPYGCRDVNFDLSWDDPNMQLGFSLIGPSGEEVLSTREPGVSSKCGFNEGSKGAIAVPTGTEQDMHLDRLGECIPGEHYSICVFSMNEVEATTDFTLDYSWRQNISREEGDLLASATEGSVLASILNVPLLYVTPSDAPETTIDTLYKLGVEQIYLVDLGNYATSITLDQIKAVGNIAKHYTTYENIYNCIRDRTGRNDVIFSTIDPWTSWYVGDLAPAEELKGALFIGPAAYIAAHHGSPVTLIDNHPELSTSVVWLNELWRRHPDGFTKLPTVSEMFLSGTRIYNFLKELGYDKEGLETIVTVGGQFDIGLPWDRIFVGKAKSGRFIGSPTDISVWLSKTIFYPQIVFENPALQNPSGVALINGSSSKRRFPWKTGLGLRITPGGEETFKYPVLDTLICYDHKFNSRASEYWGFKYKTATGKIPGETPSNNPIDEGVMEAVNGQKGAFFPDLSGSEVQPFYLRRAGYEPVFSTNFDANMENLNRGVLLWMINTHGGPMDGGLLMFWDVKRENPRGGFPAVPFTGYTREENPWRGYEWWMGSTEEPDTMSSEIHGIIPMLLGNPNGRGVFTTAFDWGLAKRPIRDIIGFFASLPIINIFAPDWLENTQDYYDGVIITVFLGRFGTSWYDGFQIDDALGNIHSTGVSSVACLPAGKYLHLNLMRHGSVFQIMDPWATSWYSDVWQNSIPRGIALGQTIGEIYEEGIRTVGIQYISDDEPNWWWDLMENVCLYGDPDLRIWVPSTEYDPKGSNHWTQEDVQPLCYNENEGFYVEGHMPYGAKEYYPHASMKSKTIVDEYLIVLIALIIIIILLIVLFTMRKKK